MDLLKFLKDNGYTQTDVAKLLDTSVKNVNKWCNGGGVPSYEFCQRLLQIGMSVEDLFGISGVDVPPSKIPPLASSELIDILKAALNESLDKVKARISDK